MGLLALPAIVLASSSPFDPCRSDTTLDKFVDISDYSFLSSKLFSGGAAGADINNDGQVDISDYSLFASTFVVGINGCEPAPTNTAIYVVTPNWKSEIINGVDGGFTTIQAAINAAKNDSKTGAKILIYPGIYRESAVVQNMKATAANPIELVSVAGKDMAFIYGSENSKSVNWTKSSGGQEFPSGVATNIYYADISTWNGAPEIAILENQTRLQKAREPDIDPFAATTTNDLRWVANGRTSASSRTSILDTTNDSGVEAGNLKSINGFTNNFLVGGRVFVMDGYTGHDHNTAVITQHSSSAGTIEFDKSMNYYSGDPLVSDRSKFYVEGRPQLLDQPGEWYYDATAKRLYIWPLNNANPKDQNIEFAIRQTGIQIRNSENIIVRNLNFAYVNYGYGRSFGPDGAVWMYNSNSEVSKDILLENLKVRHSGVGIRINQDTGTGISENVTIRGADVERTDGHALMVFNFPTRSSSNAFIPGVKKLIVENSRFDMGGYRPTGTGMMVFMQHIASVIMRNNTLSRSAHNAIEIQVDPESYHLVHNNLFEDNCLAGSDCGGFKAWASGSASRNVLVANNISRRTQGCTYASTQGAAWPSSKGTGCGGFGFYTDIVRSFDRSELGVIFYRNVAEANFDAGIFITRGRDHGIFNNLMINNSHGFRASTSNAQDQRIENTKIENNIFVVNNDNAAGSITKFGVQVKLYDYGFHIPLETEADRAAVKIGNNIYRIVGQSAYAGYLRQLSTYSSQITMKNLTDVRASSPWEDNGTQFSSGPTTVPQTLGYDIRQFEVDYGKLTVNEPADVTGMRNRIQSALGININLDSWVGVRN